MDTNKKFTTATIRAMKSRGEKIVSLTAYDFFTAKIADGVGVHLILVGDSLGMTVLGYDSTIPVTMEDMLHHCKAVTRAKPNALVVLDLPFMSYHESAEQAVRNAGRALQEGGAEAVKIEGGATVSDKVCAIVACGIPVLGHIGLTPQSVNQFGGYKVQGRDPETAKRLVADAKALEQAGVFGIVIECVPADLAKKITAAVKVPTIGIGAGADCDGQILVCHDLLGLFTYTPKHVKRYANLAEEMRRAFAQYKEEVERGKFPSENETF
jgi:3-methyl-2-oxobutanoate hydroxymethyltransferase